MRTQRVTVILLVFAACMITGAAQAKGLLVKIEHFTPAGFSPGRGESVGIDCYVLKSSVITVRIFSFAGMKVFDQKKGFFDEGKHGFSWDGKEASGAAAQAGFYRCEILAVTADGSVSDRDYAVVLVTDGETKPLGRLRSIVEEIEAFPIKISGFIRTTSKSDTSGLFTSGMLNWDHSEIQVDLKGRHGEWKYDLRAFPYFNPNQTTKLSDYIEVSAGYYGKRFSVRAGYADYLEGYSDPLNLIADHRISRDRVSLAVRAAPAENMTASASMLRMDSRDDYAAEARYTLKPTNFFKLSAFTVNRICETFSNSVIGAWSGVQAGKGTTLDFEIAGSVNSYNTQANSQVSGTALRAGIWHGFPDVPEAAGRFGVSCAFEAIQKEFTADLADLPNGNDNLGIEFIGEYSNELGFPWMRSLKVELKKAYFSAMDYKLVKQKFRPTISARIVEGLDASVHYDYFGTEDVSSGSPAPIGRTRSAFAELHYLKKNPGWDLRFQYATSSVVTASRTEYTSTRAKFGYRVGGVLFPYAGCEKIIQFTQDARDKDCYFWTLGFEWDISRKHNSLLAFQAGFVIDNDAAQGIRNVYYGEYRFRETLFNRISASLAYGSPSSIEQFQKFSVQIKIEF